MSHPDDPDDEPVTDLVTTFGGLALAGLVLAGALVLAPFAFLVRR